MTVWKNADGLAVKFGLDEAVLTNIGAYHTEGPVRLLEIIAYWGDLPAVASNQVLIDYNFSIDKGAHIESVEIIHSEDFDSTSDDMTLSVGLVDSDDSSNYVKAALVDAATQTELNAGGLNISGWVGSAVGTTLTKRQKLMWEVDTHAATAGQAVIRVKWSVPPPNGNTLVWAKS